MSLSANRPGSTNRVSSATSLKQLNLDQLRTLVMVIELGGFARAGDRLGRTQPAISLQIKKLEEQLGTKLFSKSGQRQVANAAGTKLYQYAKQLLALNDEVFRQFDDAPLSGRLRLGIPSEFATTLLPSIIGEFNTRYPDVTLEVTSALSQQLTEQAKEDQFDLVLALVERSDSEDEPLALPDNAQLVLEDTLVWAGSANHAPRGDQISLVLAPEGCRYRSRVIDTLKKQTTAWRISYTHADLYGLVAAIQQGLGITALAKSTVPPELSVFRQRFLPRLGKINICLFNYDTRHPAVSQALANFIQQRLASTV